jgi:RHS repeat-associated protein
VGAAGSFLRKLSHTLPAGASSRTTSTYYGNTEQVDNPCTAGSDPANQGGRQRLDSAADPDGTGPQTALKRESVYDASGRAVAMRVGTEPWTCTTYDARGRATKVDYPAFGGQATRTVTTNYNADPDGAGPKVASPMVTTITDPAGTLQSETDLVGRVVSYRDVWGNTTTFSYDQAGRETGNAGPVGTIARGYDNADRLATLSRNNLQVATVSYDPGNGRVSSVGYPSGTGKAGNGTTGTFAYDGVGRPSGITWTGPGGALLTKDEVGRSLGGDIVDQKTDGNDHHTGNDYVYDAAGRLVEAFVPVPAGVASRHVCYEFGTTTPNGCGAPTVGAVAAGLNTNRTRQIIQDGTTTTYTYDNADRLTSATDAAVGSIAYDAHGNTRTIFGETHDYDAADRHMATTKPTPTGTTAVSYVRDATDRIVARQVGPTGVRYGSTGSGDAPDFTTNTSNVVQEVTYSLPGGVLLTTRSTGNVWSYPNLHGDVVAVANQAGTKLGVTKVYDPYGNAIAGGIPDNSAGNFDYAWLGKTQRPLEQEPALQALIEMGARQYSPLLGRFIEVDPVKGGCANDYAYPADPVNTFDLDGRIGQRGRSCRELRSSIYNRMSTLSRRFADLRANRRSLPLRGRMSIMGHRQQFEGEQGGLRTELKQYNDKGCGPPPAGAWRWATTRTPWPRDMSSYGGIPSSNHGFHISPWHIAAAAGIGAAIYFSGGTAAPAVALL